MLQVASINIHAWGSHKTYMKATKGSISCGIKRIWHLQLKRHGIKAEGEMRCWSWQAARSFLHTVRNCSHRLGVRKGLLQTTGRRGPEGEALIPWQNEQWLQFSHLYGLPTWPGEEESVGLLASITARTVPRSEDSLEPPLYQPHGVVKSLEQQLACKHP